MSIATPANSAAPAALAFSKVFLLKNEKAENLCFLWHFKSSIFKGYSVKNKTAKILVYNKVHEF